MSRLTLDTATEVLLAPVHPVLEEALARLPDGPSLAVRLGNPGLDDGVLLLDPALADGPVHPVGELAQLPLDRWRRAATEVLTAVVVLALRSARAAPQPSWMEWGLARWMVDQACPGLGLGDPDRVLALTTGDLGRHPGAGIAAIDVLEVTSPWDWGKRTTALDVERFLVLGERALDPATGSGARLVVPVRRVQARDIPLQLGPWRWQPLSVPAHARGGRVAIAGDGAVRDSFAAADAPLDTLAASGAGGCSLRPEAGGPLGKWALSTAGGFGQVFGARGVTFDIRASGTVHVILADAFVGPVAALEVAENIGTSGTANGRWKVAGDRKIRFANLFPSGVTMHGRQRERFAVPAPDGGMGSYLKAMEDGTWTWSVDDSRLLLAGTMMGAPLELRFREEGDA